MKQKMEADLSLLLSRLEGRLICRDLAFKLPHIAKFSATVDHQVV